jgi:hypothetical protein
MAGESLPFDSETSNDHLHWLCRMRGESNITKHPESWAKIRAGLEVRQPKVLLKDHLGDGLQLGVSFSKPFPLGCPGLPGTLSPSVFQPFPCVLCPTLRKQDTLLSPPHCPMPSSIAATATLNDSYVP